MSFLARPNTRPNNRPKKPTEKQNVAQKRARAIASLRKQQKKAGGGFAQQIRSSMKVGVGKTLASNPSTRDWARVYGDPFLQANVRLPLFPIRASACLMRRGAFDMVTNSDSKGWAEFNPMNLITNDRPFAYYTNGPTANNSIGGAPTNPLDQVTSIGGGSYNEADFNPGKLAVRCVAFGFRIKYTGTEYQRGGTVYAFQRNPRNTCDGLDSAIIQSKFTEWKESPVEDQWFQYNRQYTSNDDSWFNVVNPDVVPANLWCYSDTLSIPNNENNFYMCLYIAGAAPAGSYKVEVAGHYEVVGTIAQTTGTATNTVDTVGHEKVVNALALLRSKDNTTSDHTSPQAGGFSFSSIGKVIERGAVDILAGAFM